jgi:hypothetical protein
MMLHEGAEVYKVGQNLRRRDRRDEIVNGTRISGIHAPASILVIYSAKNSKRKDGSQWRK